MSLLVYAYTLVKPDHFPARIYADKTSELVYNLTRSAAGSDASSNIRLCAALLRSSSGTGRREDMGGNGTSDGGGVKDAGRRLKQAGSGTSPQYRISNSNGGNVISYSAGLPKSGDLGNGPPANGTKSSVSNSNSNSNPTSSVSDLSTPEVRTAGGIASTVAGTSGLSTAGESSGGSGDSGGARNRSGAIDGSQLAAALKDASVAAAAFQVTQQPFNSSAWQRLANTRTSLHADPVSVTFPPRTDSFL